MQNSPLRIIILGLSITSSWGNGHATTYRGLVRELAARGHNLLFLERDMPWYAANRDLPVPPYGRTELYQSLGELKDNFAAEIREADFVVVGSYVPEGVRVGEWVTSTAGGITAFYDIDTPVTLAKLARSDFEYLSPELISRYQMYLSFTGGPTLTHLMEYYGSPMAKPLYCSVDTNHYYPQTRELIWDLGYLGTYSDDRQPALEQLMLQPARRRSEGRFVIAGPQYPNTICWPSNCDRNEHLAPEEHCNFYNSQRFTLNITRSDMVNAGYSPSIRLFEAAACGTPIITDWWEGLDTIFEPGKEILVAHSAEDTMHYLADITEDKRVEIADNAYNRVLQSHTSAHRAAELESYVLDMLACKSHM